MQTKEFDRYSLASLQQLALVIREYPSHVEELRQALTGKADKLEELQNINIGVRLKFPRYIDKSVARRIYSDSK